VEEKSLLLLRGELGYIILGTIFVFFGLSACAIAAIRRRTEVRVLIWLGIWSGMYGTGLLARTPAVVAALPPSLRLGVPHVVNAMTYLLLVAALLAWSELSTGKLRLFIRTMVFPGFAIGLAGIGWFAVTGSDSKFLPYNNLLATSALLVLTTVVMVPKLSTRFLVFPNRILTVGTLVFASEPENAAGDSFGDSKLEQVVRKSQSCSPFDLSSQLLTELGKWQPASMNQQDDITLVVIDFV
jgi:hypothetical protein